MMKIVVENRIPYIQGILEAVAQVVYLPASDITSQAVRDADALLVRTRTRCDAALLAGSRVRFIGSATIGTDHIDLDWCRDHGITVCNAPGCNAPAVAQWVMAAIGLWMQRSSIVMLVVLWHDGQNNWDSMCCLTTRHAASAFHSMSCSVAATSSRYTPRSLTVVSGPRGTCWARHRCAK